MGEVYRATDTTLGRQVAIKILPDAFGSDPERLARFEREAKTLASLNHPHIAAIYGFEKSGGVAALVMELVEGDDALALATDVDDDVVALHGDDMLKGVTLRNRLTGEERIIETSFLFLCLGGVPNTEWAEEVGIARDEEGYLVTGPDLRKFRSFAETWKVNREPYYLETCMPSVFAAGDVRHGSIKRVASAVGEGAMAIAFVHRYLALG